MTITARKAAFLALSNSNNPVRSAGAYDLLVLQRGWDPDRYGRWIAEAMIAALLPAA